MRAPWEIADSVSKRLRPRQRQYILLMRDESTHDSWIERVKTTSFERFQAQMVVPPRHVERDYRLVAYDID